MKGTLGAVLLVSLIAHVGAHVAIAVGVGRHDGWGRAALAFFVPPLGVLWGYQGGQRRAVYVWGAALATYALATTLA